MARKKADPEKKTANPLSLRLSPVSSSALDAITQESGLGKTAAVEASLVHFLKTLQRSTRKQALAEIEAKKKNPK